MDFWPQLIAFAQILLIDLSLSADNVIVIGMAAAGLPLAQRHKAILIGLGAATFMRIIFAIFAVQLLHVIGLTLAGGLILLWVGWKLYRQMPPQHTNKTDITQEDSPKTLKNAVLQIIVADVSMSLDNVLGVAGAARDHLAILVIGLLLSIILMGGASTVVVRLLHRYKWIGYAGVLVILYVALQMIWEGGGEVVRFFEAP